ncbi:hypothetical protein [Dactylosporangium sp. NPDC051541]|uniref:hypothetical protein n=1 Tax=Dactylosporangium sp. NPDC051541 TaxID=3363977 RepID=UPI0037944A9E
MEPKPRRTAVLVRYPATVARPGAAPARAPRAPRPRNVAKPVPVGPRPAAVPAPRRPHPLAAPVRAATGVAPARAAIGVLLPPESDRTDVFWRPPGRHRARELPVVHQGWHRWPWSIGFDAAVAVVGLGALEMLLDALL